MESIMNTKKGTCYLCGRRCQTECHHIFNGKAFRKKSEEDGLKIFLCYSCHHNRVHGSDVDARTLLKQAGQMTYMLKTGCGTEAFVERYGKNYLPIWYEEGELHEREPVAMD